MGMMLELVEQSLRLLDFPSGLTALDIFHGKDRTHNAGALHYAISAAWGDDSARAHFLGVQTSTHSQFISASEVALRSISTISKETFATGENYIESHLYRKSSLTNLSGSQFITLLVKLADIACLRLIRDLETEEVGIISLALCKRLRGHSPAHLRQTLQSRLDVKKQKVRECCLNQMKWEERMRSLNHELVEEMKRCTDLVASTTLRPDSNSALLELEDREAVNKMSCLINSVLEESYRFERLRDHIDCFETRDHQAGTPLSSVKVDGGSLSRLIRKYEKARQILDIDIFRKEQDKTTYIDTLQKAGEELQELLTSSTQVNAKAQELKIDDSSENFEKVAGQNSENSADSVSYMISNASTNEKSGELGSEPIFEEQSRLFLSTFLSAHAKMKKTALPKYNMCIFAL